MKKVLSLALGALLFASCTPAAFIQVVDVKGNVPVENNNFVYSDNAVKITYYLWAHGGDPGFIICNRNYFCSRQNLCCCGLFHR